MKKEMLEKKLKNLNIPEPDGSKKDAAMKAAMTEFEGVLEEKKKNIKGIETGERPIFKNLFKGGFVMNRPIVATAGVAALAMLIVISVVPVSMKDGKVDVDVTKLVLKEEHRPKTYTENMTREVRPQEGKSQESKPQEVGTGKSSRPEEISTVVVLKKEKVLKASPEPQAAKEVMVRPFRPEEKVLAMRGARSDRMAADIEEEAVMSEEASADVVSESLMTMVAPSAPSIGVARKMARQKMIVAPALQAESFTPQPDMREYAGRDRFERKEANPLKVVSEEPVSTFSIDVDTASYAFVRRALMAGNLPQKDAVRIEEMINYFNYDYEVPKSSKVPFKPTIAIYPTPWNDGTKLLHVGIKGYDIVSRKRPRANLVFLLDVSGSMHSQDKLPLLKNSLKMLVGTLHPEDTVAIAVYAGAAGTILEPTPVKEKGKIIAAMERLKAGGSTAGGAGIKLAYSLAEANFDKDAVNRVILATDGDFNVGIRDKDELKGFVERKREKGIFLSVLGFGQGNYNDELMQKLAQNGNGNAAYIDTLSEARKVLVDEAASTLFTIARDVKIQLEFNPSKVSEYRLIGYETRMLKREDFNNDKVDAGDVGSGHSVTAIYEITPAGSDARRVDALRYKDDGSKVEDSKKGEYAFLKLRYKRPGEDESRLLETPVDNSSVYGNIDKAPVDVRFAASVAAFAQLLKGGKYMGSYSYDEVVKLAGSARGRDDFGYRSEFLNLVRLAKTASAMGER